MQYQCIRAFHLQPVKDLGSHHAAYPVAWRKAQLLDQDAQAPGLLGVLRKHPNSERYISPLIDRAIELLLQPLRNAQAAGVTRADLEVEDLEILFAMFQGVSLAAESAGTPAFRFRAHDPVLEGLARRSS